MRSGFLEGLRWGFDIKMTNGVPYEIITVASPSIRQKWFQVYESEMLCVNATTTRIELLDGLRAAGYMDD